MSDHSADHDQKQVTTIGFAVFIVFIVGLVGWGVVKHQSYAANEPSPRELARMSELEEP